MTEEWRRIDGFDKRYEVSSYGQIRSTNYKNSGRIKLIRPAKDKKGYLRTMLLRNDGRYKTVKVHRIVAAIFLENPDNKPQVNHIDGNKENNRIDNLEWVSNTENAHHAVNTGLFANSIEAIRETNELRKIGIIATNIETGERQQFGSYSEARRKLKTSHIHDVLSGRRNHDKGFTFRKVVMPCHGS